MKHLMKLSLLTCTLLFSLINAVNNNVTQSPSIASDRTDSALFSILGFKPLYTYDLIKEMNKHYIAIENRNEWKRLKTVALQNLQKAENALNILLNITPIDCSNETVVQALNRIEFYRTIINNGEHRFGPTLSRTGRERRSVTLQSLVCALHCAAVDVSRTSNKPYLDTIALSNNTQLAADRNNAFSDLYVIIEKLDSIMKNYPTKKASSSCNPAKNTCASDACDYLQGDIIK